jgi:tetratricopeptide (TPR) repeat protein
MQLKSSALLFAVLSVFLPGLHAGAQQSSAPKPLSLVMPNGKGRIIVPSRETLEWNRLFLYDNGTRPVLQASTRAGGMAVSYVLFPNSTKSTAPKICRDDVVDAALQGASPFPGLLDVKQVKRFEHSPINGQPVEMGSFFIQTAIAGKIDQQNLLAVAASATACAEIHISKTSYKPADDAAMAALLDGFKFEPDYEPTSQDYFVLATFYYQVFKSYESAAVYYQRVLDTFPVQASRNDRRVIIDQLSMSYGISGDLKKSRAVNEDAIKSDPGYPLYYYNLACADAEQGKVKDAQMHLQQAFERKGNLIAGEKMPDPAKDDSILKLKKNKEFWDFVQGLK